jgi:hypothetical protein
LPLVPATGLGEMQHRRRASLDEEGKPLYNVIDAKTNYSVHEKRNFFLQAMKTYSFLEGSPWGFVRERDSLFSLLWTTIPEERVSSGEDLLSLMTATISKLENQLEPLPSPYPVSSFNDNLHAANINHYLVENEDQDDRGVHSEHYKEIYRAVDREGSSKTARSVPFEWLNPNAVSGAVSLLIRMASSYLVSSKYRVWRTKLHSQ